MTILEFNTFSFSSQTISLIQQSGIEPVKNYLEIFFPKGLEFNPPFITYYKDNFEGYYNFFVIQKNVLFLPNWLSEILQIFGNQHINTTTLRTIQAWSFGFVNKFKLLCDIRLAMWWWLMFNPYQQPFNTLRILTEWFLTALTGVFPLVIGIDIGPTISVAALGVILDVLNRLVFTMPYLPSEGEKVSITNLDQLDNIALAELIRKLGEDVTVFRYLPSLWYKYPIPDSLREYWYIKKPEILQYFLNNYSNLGIDFLPDRILQAEYENQITQASITTSLIENLSANIICSISSIFDNNLLLINLLSFHETLASH